jgi:23S rRNA (adenine2503-C2)-methyltransferase
MPFPLTDHSPDALGQLFASWGFKPSHATALLRDLLGGHEPGGCDSRRLPAALLHRLESSGSRASTSVVMRQVASDGTTKLLLQLADGATVETVLMPDFRPDRAAGCVSSQVGCAMGCDFCATTKTGFQRHLTVGEILEQFIALRREARAAGRTLQTIVFMGMGEPMLNLTAVLSAAERMADNRLGGLGARQITVSTVGIIPGIDALSDASLNVNLAVSLHAPNDTLRAGLIPVGLRYSIAEVLAAVDRFQARRPRPVTLQYCLLAGVNDAAEHARELAALVGSRRLHVNLLRYNSTGTSLRGRDYVPSSDAASEAFAAVLRDCGVVAHFRRPRGRDIDAACGQLRRRMQAAPNAI